MLKVRLNQTRRLLIGPPGAANVLNCRSGANQRRRRPILSNQWAKLHTLLSNQEAQWEAMPAGPMTSSLREAVKLDKAIWKPGADMGGGRFL